MMQQIEYTNDDEGDNEIGSEELTVNRDWDILVCSDQLLVSDSNKYAKSNKDMINFDKIILVYFSLIMRGLLMYNL